MAVLYTRQSFAADLIKWAAGLHCVAVATCARFQLKCHILLLNASHIYIQTAM